VDLDLGSRPGKARRVVPSACACRPKIPRSQDQMKTNQNRPKQNKPNSNSYILLPFSYCIIHTNCIKWTILFLSYCLPRKSCMKVPTWIHHVHHHHDHHHHHRCTPAPRKLVRFRKPAPAENKGSVSNPTSEIRPQQLLFQSWATFYTA
jgi:hypothetical protein